MSRKEKIQEMNDFYMSVSGIDYTNTFNNMTNTGLVHFYENDYRSDKAIHNEI